MSGRGSRVVPRGETTTLSWSVSTESEAAAHRVAGATRPPESACSLDSGKPGVPVGEPAPHGLMSGASLPARPVPRAPSGNRTLPGAKCYHRDQPQPRGPAASVT